MWTGKVEQLAATDSGTHPTNLIPLPTPMPQLHVVDCETVYATSRLGRRERYQAPAFHQRSARSVGENLTYIFDNYKFVGLSVEITR